MAGTKHTGSLSRRSFLAAGAVTAAAAGLPSALAASPSSWPAARLYLLPQLQAAYLAEVERLAEANRVRFESGELGGYPTEGDDTSPMDRLEDLCRSHFGLEVSRREEDGVLREEGDAEAAHLMMACSPYFAAGDVDELLGNWHEANAAACGAARDVLAVARSRGWAPARGQQLPEVEAPPAAAPSPAVALEEDHPLHAQAREAAAEAARSAQAFVSLVHQGCPAPLVAAAAHELHRTSGWAAGLNSVLAAGV